MTTALNTMTAQNYGSDQLNFYLQPVLDKGVPDKDPRFGHRIPGERIAATISKENGVYISGVSKDEIIGYEIYDLTGNMLFATTDEESFVDTVFENKGEFEIHILTNDLLYIGHILLE